MDFPVITYEMLCQISGYETPADVVAWLVENNIPYIIGKFRRPTTTTKAINQALGIFTAPSNNFRVKQIKCEQDCTVGYFPESRCGENDVRTALYRAFSHDGKLLYIGISNNPNNRLKQHRAESKWVQFMDQFIVEWHARRGCAEDSERKAISREKPIYNIIYNQS